MLPMPDIQDIQLSPETLDLIALASAYRGQLAQLQQGMGSRLPDDAEDITQACDLIEEAVYKLTIFVNRQIGQLRD